MKTKMLLLVLTISFLVWFAWNAHMPGPVQADDVPQEYRKTVSKGLEYLAARQFPDGHWEGDDGNHPVAMTGLAGLALLMEREAPGLRRRAGEHREVKYAAQIRKAANWLASKSQAGRDGLIFSEHASERTRYMQGHGLATLFLAGVCQDEKDDARRKKLTDIVAKAVKYIVSAQSTQGGWYDTSRAEGHDFASIPATALQIQALQAAENAGIPVPGAVVNDAREYLRTMLGKIAAEPKVQPNGRLPVDAATALACLIEASRRTNLARVDAGQPRDEFERKLFKQCETELPVGRGLKLGRDELAHYWLAQAQFDRGGEAWKTYRTALFDELKARQNKDGSWPAGNGICVGPVYSTAIWCTVLQLDNGSHPTKRQLEFLDVTDGRPALRTRSPGMRFPMAFDSDSRA